MSGEDAAKLAENGITPVTPPWLANTTPTTVPAAGPGQMSMLADQLAKGGYGTPQSNMGWLGQIYSPAQTTSFGTAPAASSGSSSSGPVTVSTLPSDAELVPGTTFSYGGYDFNQYKLPDGSIVNYTGAAPTAESSSASTGPVNKNWMGGKGSR